MAQHRSVSCPATTMVLPLAGIFAGLSAGAVNAHMAGVEAARQAREDRASHVLAWQVDEAIESAQAWADLAKAQAEELVQLRAEKERMIEAAWSRQALIGHLMEKVKKLELELAVANTEYAA